MTAEIRIGREELATLADDAGDLTRLRWMLAAQCERIDVTGALRDAGDLRVLARALDNLAASLDTLVWDWGQRAERTEVEAAVQQALAVADPRHGLHTV